MINTRRYYSKLWQTWRSVIMLIGLLLTITGCSSKKPPTIIGFEPSNPTAAANGQIYITVDYAPNDYNVLDFEWHPEEGRILGDGPTVTYQAPDTPGSYYITVRLKYSGGVIEDSIIVEVVQTLVSSTYTATPNLVDTPTPIPTDTPTPIPTDTPTPIPTDTPTPIPTDTPTPIPTDIPTPTPSPIPYSAPVLTSPDDGSGVQGEFPPLYWNWDGKLGEDEFFEVRVWHEDITTYHPALGWVKVPQFDYNIRGERKGKYYWTVIVVKGANPKPKDWTLQSWWPYPMWEGALVAELSPEPEPRFFMFTPDDGGGPGGPISVPSTPCSHPSCGG